MPSEAELLKLYVNRATIGGFGTGYYWSSSEYYPVVAAQPFSTGVQVNADKSYTYSVRAVRAF